MIFSIGHSASIVNLPSLEKVDIFCFFSAQNSVVIPASSLNVSVMASLKNKKSVLILERPFIQLPVENSTKQWEAGDGYLWLAPHGLSVFLLAVQQESGTYPVIKNWLIKSKDP